MAKKVSKKDIHTIERYVKAVERYKRNIEKGREKRSSALEKEAAQLEQYLTKRGKPRKRVKKEMLAHASEFLARKSLSVASRRKGVYKKKVETLAKNPLLGTTVAEEPTREDKEKARNAIAFFVAFNTDSLNETLLLKSEQIIELSRDHDDISTDDLKTIAEFVKRDKQRENSFLLDQYEIGDSLSQDDTARVIDVLLSATKNFKGTDLKEFEGLQEKIEEYSKQLNSGAMSFIDLLKEIDPKLGKG